MRRERLYTIGDLKRDFPDDRACLEFLFDASHSRTCECGGTFSFMPTRPKQFQCSKCARQVSPCRGTIFFKSSTPLTLWFQAIHVFSNAKSGISASEMERRLGVTYKTAWRMLRLVRESLYRDGGKLSGTVEVDTGFFGGARKPKAVVMAAAERGGRIVAKVVPENTASETGKFLVENVEKRGTSLMTDRGAVYNTRAVRGYRRRSVNHSKGEYARRGAHINTVEVFWGHVKRSVSGTHKVISKQHLQSYLDGFSFHWNHRASDRNRFSVLVGRLLRV